MFKRVVNRVNTSKCNSCVEALLIRICLYNNASNESGIGFVSFFLSVYSPNEIPIQASSGLKLNFTSSFA